MKKLLVILTSYVLVAFIGFDAVASISETQKMYQTKDFSSLRVSIMIKKPQLLKAFDRLIESREMCEIELKRGLVPKSCYQMIQTEKELQLHKTNSAANVVAKLDRACLRAVKKEMFASVSVSELPQGKCKEYVEEKVSEIAYVNESKNPELILQQ